MPVGDDAAVALWEVPEPALLPVGDDAAVALWEVPEPALLPVRDDAAVALWSVSHASGVVPPVRRSRMPADTTRLVPADFDSSPVSTVARPALPALGGSVLSALGARDLPDAIGRGRLPVDRSVPVDRVRSGRWRRPGRVRTSVGFGVPDGELLTRGSGASGKDSVA